MPADTIVIHGEEDDVVPLADVFAWARPQELPVACFPAAGISSTAGCRSSARTIAGDVAQRGNRHVMSASIRRVRTDLAACYRLGAHFRMTDLIYTHISARVPGRRAHFLINPYGLLFEEITASSLVKVTLDGEIVDDPTGLGINPAGFVIHSAIHARAPRRRLRDAHAHRRRARRRGAEAAASCRSRSTRCASPIASPTTTTKASRSTLTSRSGSSAISAGTTR